MTHPFSRRAFLRLGFGAGAALALGACGRPGSVEQAVEAMTLSSTGYDGPPVNLEFWNGFTGGDGPLMRDLVDRFNEEHPEITVRMNTLEWAQFYETVPAAVATGQGPDVACMHLDAIGTAAARGVITPLDDVTDTYGLDSDDFTERIWEGGLYQDRRYGVPLDVHPIGFYFNTALMEEAGLDPQAPPRTRDDYEQALEAFADAGIQGMWISSMPFTGLLVYQTLLWQFGGQLYSDDGTRAVWSSDEGIAALEWMVGLLEAGHSPRNVAQDAEHIAFENAQNAFLWNGIWMIIPYGENPDLEWGVAPVPNIGGSDAVWASSHNLVLMNKPPHDERRRAAGATFIDWLTAQSLAWAEAGQIPARTSVRESEEFRSLDAQPIFAEQLDYVETIPAVPGIGDAQSELEDGYGRAVLGLESPEEALAKAADRANQLLEINAEKYGEEVA